MSKRTRAIAHAAVSRLAHAAPGMRIQSAAIDFARDEAEKYIEELFTGAKHFTSHRKGTMVMKQDLEAYIESISN